MLEGSAVSHPIALDTASALSERVSCRESVVVQRHSNGRQIGICQTVLLNFVTEEDAMPKTALRCSGWRLRKERAQNGSGGRSVAAGRLVVPNAADGTP